MEFRDLLEIHRTRLQENVDPDKLYQALEQDKAISGEEILQLETLPTKSAQVGKLLDLLLTKDNSALQSFYLALQNMYQPLLTAMYEEPVGTQQESFSPSVTSDSEDDVGRGQVATSARLQEFSNRSKMTKIIPSHQYDPNSTVSSSYPTFRDHSSPLSTSMDHNSASLASLYDTYGVPRHGYQDRYYDWFFKQFECAFKELQVLKQQNAEMMGMRERYDQVTKEVKHLRGMYQSESQCLQRATAEIDSLKAQQGELVSEKKHLLDEVAELQKLRAEDKQELSQLRHQQKKASSEDAMGEMYASMVEKYETLDKDYDMLREKYSQLAGSHSAALSRLDGLTEEMMALRAQLEDQQNKNDALTQERNGLKQQCTNAIREWNQTLYNLGQMKEKLSLVIKQRDDFCTDFNQTFAKHAELKKSFEALRAEKDAAVKEYALVMSERDTVHKEIEQLQDKLNAVGKHAEKLSIEKKTLEVELESVRHDMSTVLTERDKYRRERNDMSGINQGLKHERLDFQKRMEQQRDLARKERNEAYEQMEHMEQLIKENYEKTQKERAQEVENILKDSENLKKQLEKLKVDLDNAEQEAENANKNRDKAFSERDKIVQERESIRSLCDNLRRDRDRAVSDLAQALRDSDEFKRQKNEAVKELKEIKNGYETMGDNRRQHLHYIGHNHSRDSAIDADLQELGTETVEIPIELHCAGSEELGFDVIGGKEDPQFDNDPSLIVSHVTKGGAAEGKLKVNDTVLRINSLETINVDKRTALQAIRRSAGAIHLVVRRRKTTRTWQPVQIVLACQKEAGIQIEQGLFISGICPGGLVAKYGVLPCIGDRIIHINKMPAESLSARDAMRILESSTDPLVLEVWRQASPLSSAGSSPTPTCTGINSPLPDGSSISKSDSLAMQGCSWETACHVNLEGSKNLRSSGSQTDSLDSPGKQEQEKTRHSLPMLDRAKEKVENFFRPRPKSQERELVEEDCGTQINLRSTESVIAQFPDSTARADMTSSKSPRKELDFETNSGTWPKTRGQQMDSTCVHPTVICAPGHKPVKERPSIRDVFYGGPDFHRPVSSSGHHHDYQSSAFSPTMSSNSQAQHAPHSTQYTPFSIPVSLKSHFSVGVMHGPGTPPHTSVVTSGGPSVFPKPAQVYSSLQAGTLPSQGIAQRGSLISAHAGVSPTSTVPQDFRFDPTTHRVPPKTQHRKSRGPTSAHKPALAPACNTSSLHWQTPAPIHWPTPAAESSGQRPVSGSQSSYYVVSPPPYGMRPTSLEVHPSMKISEFDLCSGHHQTSPADWRPASYHPSVSTPLQHAALASLGTFPGISQSDMEQEKHLSFTRSPNDRYSSPSPSQKSCSTLERFTPSISEEHFPSRYSRTSPHGRTFLDDDIRQAAKRDKVFERIRIPSSTSVNTKSGSVEIVSDRSSPGSPLFHIEKRNSVKYNGSPNSDDCCYRRKIPCHHETRDITFEKSSKPVGFKIQRGPSGGIFVSSVYENSLADLAGLVIGDQLLEVCGINMRNANYEHAVTVLRQCGDNLTMKVQYNPEKYTDHQDVSSSATSINSSSMAPPHSATPSRQASPNKTYGSGDADIRRYISLKKSNPSLIGPGFSFIGGNAVGIFIEEVYLDCFVGSTTSLQRGDQLLEFNSVDFRSVTAEKAMIELNRPCATLQLCVFYNMAKYKKIQHGPCDSFYIRANFERTSEREEELSFHKDDILYVENSLYKQQLGTWYAWLVNDQGNKVKAGIIPSRIRLEDEMVLRRTHSESWSLHESDDIKNSRRGSGSARRSFFRRKRHHRNNSRDSHDFGSFSDASLNSDSVPVLDDSILGYTQVEKKEFKSVRPVVLLAPLAEALSLKLESESPDKYKYCEPTPMKTSPATMEQSLAEGVLVDYWRKDDMYLCIRASAVREICDKNIHCLLNVSPSAVERLHHYKIYPITIFVHHKSAKQIREIRDPQFLKDRASNKLAKEQFEQFQKIEQDFHHLFTATIQGGNLAEMCMQIKTVIAAEQKKAIWVTTNIL
ncbi:disks large homolog 5-like isoform X2 [Physella acuta]|uniref:disks large homolog 5-like isoform X2 n=1 Tax=Physella acuta TaxID=109671 RepID=UPI0027DD48B3|nr:disks large homolog 5-like isoform X2 [Physella acuta]